MNTLLEQMTYADPLIFTVNIMGVLLVFYLLFRMAQFRRIENESDDLDSLASSKKELAVLFMAQRFTALQLNVVEDEYKNKVSELPDKLKKSVMVYISAAIEAIGRSQECSQKYRRVITVKVLRSYFDLSAKELSDIYSETIKRSPYDREDMLVRMGTKAAKSWLKTQTTNEHFSLFSQIQGSLPANC